MIPHRLRAIDVNRSWRVRPTGMCEGLFNLFLTKTMYAWLTFHVVDQATHI